MPRPLHVLILAGLALAVLLTACSSDAEPSASAAPLSSSAPSENAPTTPSSDARPSADDATAEPTAAGLASDPLHALALRDVRSGSEFTLGQLAAEKPVLLETMAIWCTNCRAQQHNVVDAHGLADFHSISLDVDPSELPNDLADYADREGFDWRFAMANAEVVSALRDRFGTAISNPPSMPKILFRPDGSVELVGLGQLMSPEELAAAMDS